MSKYFPENVDTVEPYRPEICVITAAAGGVGLQACQFALAAGNIVVGLAGNEEKLAALAKLGVQHAVNYKAHGSPRELAAHIGKLAGRDVDLVWETVGGEMLVALSEIIGENGRLVIIGQISGGYGDEASAKQRQADLDKPSELRGAGVLLAAPNPARDKALENLQQKNAKLTGYFMSITGTDCFDTFARFVAAQVGLWESKDLRPVTDDSQKFRGIDAYVDGVEYLHRGQNIGKIVVTVAED